MKIRVYQDTGAARPKTKQEKISLNKGEILTVKMTAWCRNPRQRDEEGLVYFSSKGCSKGRSGIRRFDAHSIKQIKRGAMRKARIEI